MTIREQQKDGAAERREGQPKRVIEKRGVGDRGRSKTTYTYGSQGQLAQEEETRFSEDGKKETSRTVTEYTYDDQGRAATVDRKVRVSLQQGKPMEYSFHEEYAYDGDFREPVYESRDVIRDGEKRASSYAEQTLDEEGRVLSREMTTDIGVSRTEYEYDEQGREALMRQIDPNGGGMEYLKHYDVDGRLAREDRRQIGGDILGSVQSVYQKGGKKVTTTNLFGVENPERVWEEVREYDGEGQLVKMSHDNFDRDVRWENKNTLTYES